MHSELLIGCGSRRTKDTRLPTFLELVHSIVGSRDRHGLSFEHLVTLDNNASHKPDIICDLDSVYARENVNGVITQSFIVEEWNDHANPFIFERSKIIASNSFDEIHAYEVLEHIGRQGDATTFFAQFSEFHRILKPNGLLYATCPAWHSPWAWGDPSHSRVLTVGTLAFLSQEAYKLQVGKTPMSDFRHMYSADFEVVFADESTGTLLFCIRAIK